MTDRTSTASLGEQVKEARIAAGVSQEELALLASMSRRPLYLLESGRGTVRLETLERILDALGLELQIRPKSKP